MSSEVIEFPVNRQASTAQDQIDAVLANDPNYKFIFELLSAMSDIGLPMEETPAAKARELYAKYQRDNTFARWARELENEVE